MSLRSNVIRLASVNPSLRPHLLPLLKAGARDPDQDYDNWKDTRQEREEEAMQEEHERSRRNQGVHQLEKQSEKIMREIAVELKRLGLDSQELQVGTTLDVETGAAWAYVSDAVKALGYHLTGPERSPATYKKGDVVLTVLFVGSDRRGDIDQVVVTSNLAAQAMYYEDMD